jgi:trehalose/maltose hydrolase-like predicted phosphorylase
MEAPMTDTWLLSEDRILPEQVPWKESLFSVANGHLGTRGSFEEGYRGSVPATFMHGLFVTPPGGLPHLFPLPDWTGCSITVDGMRFRLDEHPPAGYERDLDMRTGVLSRRVLWRGPGTGLVRVEFRRLLSLARPELASLEVTITSLTDDVQVSVETGLDGSVASPLSDVWETVDWERTGRERLTMRAETEDRASVTATTVVHDLAPLSLIDDPRHPRLTATIDLAPGQRLAFVKHTTYQRGNTAGPAPPSDRFDSIAAASAAEWSRRWDSSRIEVSGDHFAERALRFAAFHLIGAAPRTADGGLGARLLSGYGYMHHVFWDTDVFVVPYLTMTQPDLARAHLGYRYRGLDGARRKAAYYGRSGAFYAWESAGTGDECTPEWGGTPDGEQIRIRTGEIEEHIVADVSYALDHYLAWVGDREFLRNHGAEMTLEGARYWQDRIEVDDGGRGHLRNVIGPNEYHIDVDDNFFTNAMAAWHLRAAVRHAAELKDFDRSRYHDLITGLGLSTGWENSFLGLADSVTPRPGPDGIFEEHSGYFSLDAVDLTVFEPRRLSLQAILGEKWIGRSQITKQADVVMGLILLEDHQTPDLVRAQLDYYAPRTDHGSSLSLAVHSIAASIGMRPDQAYSYFREAAAIDLDDAMGNGDHGIHAATQGGLLQAALIGFGGLHLTDDGPQLTPRLPEHWDSLGFSFVYRGTRYERETRVDKPARKARAPRADHNVGG